MKLILLCFYLLSVEVIVAGAHFEFNQFIADKMGENVCAATAASNALFSPPGLRRAEVRGGGFSAGDELFGQIFISGGHQENKTAAARSNLHVSSIQDEGDCPPHCREALHLHGQLGPSRGAAGNYLLQTWLFHNT